MPIGMGFYPIDRYYLILVLPAVLFAMWAQMQVGGKFKKYSAVPTARRITGAQAAERVLRQAGVTGVRIERVAGSMTDHYDPRDNVIRLSETVFDATSVAAVGVAAHEAGHAVQYATGYQPIRIRNAIVPVANIGSRLALPLVLLGFLFSIRPLFMVGIVFMGAAVVFQLVTLPVEFNASSRAVVALEEGQLLNDDELPGAKSVLRAAAFTYVAALAVSLAQLLRLLLLFGRNQRRN